MIKGRRKSLIFYILLHFGFHGPGPEPAEREGLLLPWCDLYAKVFIQASAQGGRIPEKYRVRLQRVGE